MARTDLHADVRTQLRTDKRTAPRRRDPVVPPQHGAWGFLALPVALGVAVGGWDWSGLPAVAAWVALYPFSWALTQRLAARRPERFTRALAIWAGVAAPLVALSAVLHPWLIWVGLGYVVPLAVNIAFARARRERALGNDLVLVGECVLAVPVTVGLVGSRGSWAVPWETALTADVATVAAVCALVLVSSTLHVKSLIRERNNPAFTTVSRWFAVACVPLVAGLALAIDAGWVLVVPFVALAGRAAFLHDPTWKPARIGLIELAVLVVTVVCTAVALA